MNETTKRIGNQLAELRKLKGYNQVQAAERKTCSIDFDGIYDTDYVRTVDELSKDEEEILVDGLDTCDYYNMSDELREYVKQELAPKYGKEVEDEC